MKFLLLIASCYMSQIVAQITIKDSSSINQKIELYRPTIDSFAKAQSNLNTLILVDTNYSEFFYKCHDGRIFINQYSYLDTMIPNRLKAYRVNPYLLGLKTIDVGTLVQLGKNERIFLKDDLYNDSIYKHHFGGKKEHELNKEEKILLSHLEDSVFRISNGLNAKIVVDALYIDDNLHLLYMQPFIQNIMSLFPQLSPWNRAHWHFGLITIDKNFAVSTTAVSCPH